MTRLVVLIALLAAPLVARASTSNCMGIGDGTACTTECIMAGTCESNVCVPTSTRPNGSSCSSGDKCTVDDTCQNGQCVPGGAITCPGEDACHVGECVPSIGCVVVTVCKNDLAMPPGDMSPADMRPSDASAGPDQGPHDLLDTDACFMPPGSELLVCHYMDGSVIVPLADLAGDDLAGYLYADFGPRGGHLRGSRPGDCDVAPGARTIAPLALFCLALFACLLRRRA